MTADEVLAELLLGLPPDAAIRDEFYLSYIHFKKCSIYLHRRKTAPSYLVRLFGPRAGHRWAMEIRVARGELLYFTYETLEEVEDALREKEYLFE